MNFRPFMLLAAFSLVGMMTGCSSEPETSSQPLSSSWGGHGASIVEPTIADPTTGVVTCSACHASAPHYDGALGGNAQFVANNAQCTDCHAGGDVTANAAILQQYAGSGHGDVEGPAWATSVSHDWPNAVTTTTGGDCKGCHSTTGFIVRLGGTTTTPVVGGVGQTLACKACHTNLSTGALRYATEVTAYYKHRTYNTGASTWNAAGFAIFPDLGVQNNLCINCHSGRESGESILALADAGMNNVSFVNPHYLGAAGMMYAKLAFIDFIDRDTVVTSGTTTFTYGTSVTASEDGGKLTSTHRKLGTTAINGDSHNPAFFVPGNLDGGGPCITCHMAGVANHTWGIGQASIDNVCSKCHDDEFTDVVGLKLFLEEEDVPFADATALAIAKLKSSFNISYSSDWPYFYDDDLAPLTAVKDWTRGGTLTAAEAKKLMGAALNIKLMKADPAAYLHSRTYARRVLYDTIDWLDDKAINMSTGATALAWNNVKYVKDATAGGTTTESLKYLVGYNRTSLVWNTFERP